MSKKRMVFPMEVPHGSVTVKNYRGRNKAYRVTTSDGEIKEKERFSFFVSYFSDGKRTQKMFAEFKEALAGAKSAPGRLLSIGGLGFVWVLARKRRWPTASPQGHAVG